MLTKIYIIYHFYKVKSFFADIKTMSIRISSSSSISSNKPNIDNEHQNIINKLLAKGIKPTYNKAQDRVLLHEAELKDLKQMISTDNEIIDSTNFLTIKSEEIEKLRLEMKQKKKKQDPADIEQSKIFKDQTGASQLALYRKWQILNN